MPVKFLIFIVIILEMFFLGWTTSIDRARQDLQEETILLEQNRAIEEATKELLDLSELTTNINLLVKEKGSSDIVGKAFPLDVHYLDLKGKRLTALIDKKLEKRKLNIITEIDASNNYLTELPEYFLEMKKLKKLYLGNNKIKYLDYLSSTYSVSPVETLDLSDNRLTSYSTNIIDLPSLRYLNLSGNYNLSKIYMEKEDVQYLKELNLKYTAIADDSLKIAQLYKLLPSDAKIVF